MKNKIIFTSLLVLSLHSFSQEKALPKGWDLVTLEGKTAYMNLITGDISTSFPLKPALKPKVVKEYDPTIIHIVKKGETLSSIGKKYNKSLVDMYRLNNVESFDKIEIGQEIVVGYNEIAKETVNEKHEDTMLHNNYYIVTTGDTLYRIAKTHNLTIQKLKEQNNLNSNTIYVGQKLIVN